MFILTHHNCAGITGANIRVDKNGDSEGNFSVLAFKESNIIAKDASFSCASHMIQVATFYPSNDENDELFVSLHLTLKCRL